jgi:outer membrane protein TolC
MNVTDRSDLLQSLASLKTKELTYQNDLETLRQASMKFNSIRNVPDDSVAENLQAIGDFLDTDISKDIVRKAVRADVIVAIANAQKSKADAKSSEIKNQPDISLMGTYQFDGRGTDSGTGMGTSWNGDNPYLTAQLNLTIPLDFAEIHRMNEGYKAQAAAAEATTARAKFDLDQDWLDLEKQFKDAMSRLTLARELEKLQGEKLRYERERFASGRTTSFQVLQFEDNFSDASLSKLKVENELIAMRAKARLYNGDVK